MKKIVSLMLVLALFSVVLAACGSQEAASSAAPASASEVAPSSSQAPAASSEMQEASSVEAIMVDLSGLVAQLAEAAGLGTTIDMIEMDLVAGGITADNVVQFVGVQSQLVIENGGAVILIEATEGTAETVMSELESYRDFALGNEDYAEFAGARDNIEQARIEVKGNYVVYAVSAVGDWEALDAAIESAMSTL